MSQVRVISYFVILSALFWVGAAQSEEEIITIEGTRITGNQESPTILYVVPWQPPEVEALEASASIKQLDSSIEPIERSEFRRLLGYHEHFRFVTGSGQNTEQDLPATKDLKIRE